MKSPVEQLGTLASKVLLVNWHPDEAKFNFNLLAPHFPPVVACCTSILISEPLETE
jgi:hypothetical protein